MASYKTKIARLNALLDAQAQVIQEYAAQAAELERWKLEQLQTWDKVDTFARKYTRLGASVSDVALELMKRGVATEAPAVPLVDGSDDYYDYLGALVEQHPAGIMRRNTDDKAPAVPLVCKDCGQSWTNPSQHANLCVAEMLRQDTKQVPDLHTANADKFFAQEQSQ